MKMNRFKGLLVSLPAVLVCAAASTGAWAQGAHARISASQARAAALRRYPGRVEGKVALEDEEGKWQYAVNVRSGKRLREVMVSARTGKIESTEVTTKAEERKEARAEAAAKGGKMHGGH